MRSRHVRGPWIFDPTHNSEADGTGHDVGQILTGDAMVRICEGVDEPNAALITAAPTMYDALVRIALICDDTAMSPTLRNAITDIARNAVATVTPPRPNR